MVGNTIDSRVGKGGSPSNVEEVCFPTSKSLPHIINDEPIIFSLRLLVLDRKAKIFFKGITFLNVKTGGDPIP